MKSLILVSKPSHTELLGGMGSEINERSRGKDQKHPTEENKRKERK
jgi:hypothetical protein